MGDKNVLIPLLALSVFENLGNLAKIIGFKRTERHVKAPTTKSVMIDGILNREEPTKKARKVVNSVSKLKSCRDIIFQTLTKLIPVVLSKNCGCCVANI